MARILEDTDHEMAAEDADVALSLEEERQAAALGNYQEYKGGDLTDGGAVGGAQIFPTQNGVKQERGRPAARRAWMYDGTETVLPLAWNPDGTAHDFARRYMRKKHCMCCGHNGVFRKGQCNDCVFNSCTRCRSGSDPTKIIPCFYLKQEDVPFPQNFYGQIPCFLPLCPRTGEYGFLTNEDMRIHARSRHHMEYQAHQETIAANKTDEMDAMRAQINTLLVAALHGNAPVDVPVGEAVEIEGTLLIIKDAVEESFTVTVDNPEAPLYVSDNPPKPKKARRKRKSK